MLKVSWAITVLMCCAAAWEYISVMSAGPNAPQEAALAGRTLAMVVIPYVFTRSIEKLFEKQVQRVEVVNMPGGGSPAKKLEPLPNESVM